MLDCIVQIDEEKEGPCFFLFLMGLSSDVNVLVCLLELSSLLCFRCVEFVNGFYLFILKIKINICLN